jgi:putative endonuclease
VTLGSCFRRSARQEAETKSGCVYIMANQRNGTIYTGVTSDLPARVYQHRNGIIESFSKKHGCKLLVWYEAYEDLDAARLRERQMKKWKRAWKIELIERSNPQWKDLWPQIAQPL